jgi:hypothetical protein
MIVAASSACAAGVVLLALSPRGEHAYWLALAQSGAMFVGLAVGFALAAATKPMWPSALDLLSILVATATMLVVVMPLRALPPGLPVLVAQGALGLAVYAGVAYVLDIARLRRRIALLRKPFARRIEVK